MIKPIVWSAVAKQNLKEIKRFFDTRNQNPEYSKKLLRVFKNAARVIERQPKIGKNTDIAGIKGFIVLNYIIFYEVLLSHIFVLMVWDCRRDPEQIKKFLRN